MWIRLFVVISILASMVSARAQPNLQVEPAVQLIGISDGEKIMLRWGVNDYLAWVRSNTAGYGIERHTIVRDGEVLADPDIRLMTGSPLLPRPLSEWESTFDEDQYVAIAAQALYGETFEVDYGSAGSMGQIVNNAKASDQRFQIALLAADRSLQAAKLSGLYFEDTSVKEGEEYLYRVFSYASPSAMEIDTGFVFLDLQSTLPELAPYDLNVEFQDRAALLEWNVQFLDRYYNGFFIERADDGETFERTTDTPIPFKTGKNLMRWLDSIPENNKAYQYRIKAVNSFGMESIPSDTVSGIGRSSFTSYAEELQSEIINNERVRLNWQFDASEENLDYFQILRSATSTGLADTLARVESDGREYLDNAPISTAYYRVISRSRFGASTSSFPVLVQLEDSIPPAAPVGLSGKIETNGVVNIQWADNVEPDLLGYRVYRSNSRIAEFSQITVSAVPESAYRDSINVSRLDERIYYRVFAVDKRNNQSVASDTLVLDLPDVVPPAQPVFSKLTSDSVGVLLQWIPSVSEDVQNQLLYRRKQTDAKWQLLKVFDDNIQNEFTDSDLEIGGQAAYLIIAVDEVGNESQPTKPVIGKRIDNGQRPPIANISLDVDTQNQILKLAWDYPIQGVMRYQIFRAEPDSSMTMVASTEDTSYEEGLGSPAGERSYMVQAVFKNGSSSQLSEIVKAVW